MAKALYRFVHLSDIHFGQEKGGTLHFHTDVREQLVADCRRQGDAFGAAADGILITGDTAYGGTHDEFKRAGEWLEQLAQAVGCDVLLIRTIPGNHDIDRSKIRHFCEIAHANIRAQDDTHVDGCLDAMMQDEEDVNPLIPKIAAYREFAARFGCDFESIKKPFWRKDYDFPCGNRLALIGMNSVQISDSFDCQGQMVLGSKQYILTETEDNVEYVVLVHHPIHWFKDRANIQRYLWRARVVMSGHEHELRIQEVKDDFGRSRLDIYAGATNPPESNIEYRYNWIEFSHHNSAGKAYLKVTVHPRVWNRDKTEFVPDHTRAHSTFELECPRFSTTSCAERVHTTHTAENAGEQSAMADSDDRGFERLQYFFWTYLDWDRRIKALADADVLPNVPSQPMPQTLERLALESARNRGLLSTLWDRVMESVPITKRVPNPFRST